MIPVVGVFLGPVFLGLGFFVPFFGLGAGVKDSLSAPKKYLAIEGPCPYCRGNNSVKMTNFDDDDKLDYVNEFVI